MHHETLQWKAILREYNHHFHQSSCDYLQETPRSGWLPIDVPSQEGLWTVTEPLPKISASPAYTSQPAVWVSALIAGSAMVSGGITVYRV